ncbi:amino acid ABC transporter ATP-binding protein [Calidifontibacter sp. DB0510]|uniref:Amino acid ABC transporter ATP-binding protein n=1 Tax=Metallococcus carri TaxID=1656884 RepID=A0A967B4G4_9MICO|nr:amino acid ABC transporter ATP-binding protein [Metallococcus carri]NOP38012.1 amino acid ABC transporter ATP-binding protein [Calidifontibacter sp. DB2511S]
MVRIRNLHKQFGSHTVLDGVDLDLAEGSVTAILGPSGSGKSTLLRCINHLERPDRGYVEVGGEIIGFRPDGNRLRERSPREIAAQRARIGMVFQHFNLFAHRTAAENIVEGPLAQGVPVRTARARASELLARVGLAGRDDAYPSQLSGGQQQRVAIARALAMDPALILFDEPTSALDPELVGEVLSVIKDLAATGITLAIVTHEIGFAREVADQVVFLEDGHIIESGDPATVLQHTQSERARAFLAAVL